MMLFDAICADYLWIFCGNVLLKNFFSVFHRLKVFYLYLRRHSMSIG